jgi:protein O-GlcNAc transferase
MTDLSPTSSESPAQKHYLMGRRLQAMGQFARAIEQFRASLAIESDNALAHADLALSLSAYGQGTAALSEAKIALRLETNIPVIHFIYGAILNKMGEPKAAIPFFQQALALYPDYADVYMGLASSYRALELYEESEKNVRKALEIELENASAQLLIGGIRLEQGRYVEAWPFLEAVLRLKPEEAESHIGLGVYFLKTGEIDRALTHCREALRLEPDNKNAKEILVEALAHKNWIYATLWKWSLPSTNTLESVAGGCGILSFIVFGTIARLIYKIVTSGESLLPYLIGLVAIVLLLSISVYIGIILLKGHLRRTN